VSSMAYYSPRRALLAGPPIHGGCLHPPSRLSLVKSSHLRRFALGARGAGGGANEETPLATPSTAKAAAGAAVGGLRAGISMAAEAEPTTLPTDYVRVKRKKTTIFLYMEPNDSVHDLRARINHITKVPTTDVKFFIDINGEVEVVENKSLADQKASRSPHSRMFFPRPPAGCCSCASRNRPCFFI
jgi:hypothetical protein